MIIVKDGVYTASARAGTLTISASAATRPAAINLLIDLMGLIETAWR